MYNVKNVIRQRNQPALYYLTDGLPRGFVSEELMKPDHEPSRSAMPDRILINSSQITLRTKLHQQQSKQHSLTYNNLFAPNSRYKIMLIGFSGYTIVCNLLFCVERANAYFILFVYSSLIAMTPNSYLVVSNSFPLPHNENLFQLMLFEHPFYH